VRTGRARLNALGEEYAGQRRSHLLGGEILGNVNKKRDSDGDGLSDGTEVHRYYTNPTTADTDGDLVNDGQEVKSDTDPLDPTNGTDRDHDGVPSSQDNCPFAFNPDQQTQTRMGSVRQQADRVLRIKMAGWYE
jgi:hypothetical protein